MKKRLIATVLAAILLLLALPVSASAATNIIDKSNGGTYRKLTAYDWVYYYQYLYGQYPGYIYLPDYPYPPYYWYPGFDYEDIDRPWPIFLPDQPYLPQPPKDSEDISNYYYYLLWL